MSEDTMNYIPVQRTGIEELKWLEMQAKIAEIKKEMGDKWCCHIDNAPKKGNYGI